MLPNGNILAGGIDSSVSTDSTAGLSARIRNANRASGAAGS